MTYTDSELLSLMQNDDPFGFEAIYDRYVKLVFRLVNKNITSKEDSEEIVQEIFESLWARRAELGHIVNFNYYILRMAKYKVIHYIRRKGVRRKYEAHYKLFEIAYDFIPEEQRTPEQITEQILKHIVELPDRCQEAVKMRILEQLSNREIAERMNINKRTVENYMRGAFNHFRSLYDQIYHVG